MKNDITEFDKKIKILQAKVEKSKTDEDKKNLKSDILELKDRIETFEEEKQIKMHWWECVAYTVGEFFPPVYALLGFGCYSEYKKGISIKQFAIDRFNTIGKMIVSITE